MSEPTPTSEERLANLHKAKAIMAGLERTPKIEPQILLNKWMQAVQLIAQAGFEIQGTDEKTKGKFDHQSQAREIEKRINKVAKCIAIGNKDSIVKQGWNLSHEMEIGIGATILPNSSGQIKR